MKYLISYFYQIRHFDKNMIPVSTALWDPKWYHDNSSFKHHIFKDSRGVINGCRCERLHFPKELYDDLKDEGCKGQPCKFEPSSCTFLKEYRKYLFSLDFSSILNELQEIAFNTKKTFEIKGSPIVVLMVHEANNNPCSERGPLIELFEHNNIQLNEFFQNIDIEGKLVLK